MTEPITLRHGTFLPAAEASLDTLEGSWIADAASGDRRSKLGISDQSYVDWMRDLLAWAAERLQLDRPLRVLDVGCGTGELTTLMRRLGARSTGVDVHQEHLALARMLARDNDFDEDMFRNVDGTDLPFEDGAFDLVHLHVVVEHLSDPVLRALLPELRRVCAGLVHIVVPSRLQWIDDHTGLPLLPLLPRRLATWMLARKGIAYGISADGTWDVYYRTPKRLTRMFRSEGFEVGFPPEHLMFPPIDEPSQWPLHLYGELGTTGAKRLVWRVLGFLIRVSQAGTPPLGLLPYLNLVLSPTPAGQAKHRG